MGFGGEKRREMQTVPFEHTDDFHSVNNEKCQRSSRAQIKIRLFLRIHQYTTTTLWGFFGLGFFFRYFFRLFEGGGGSSSVDDGVAFLLLT